jgi:hypothetical protein
LLTGPTFPESFNTFDGQGIPDAFRLGPIEDPEVTDGTSLIIGVGVCDLEADVVREFCTWDVSQTETEIRFRSEQVYGSTSYVLERVVSLYERTVRSWTKLTNRAGRPLYFRWFPHPFYPQTETDELCRFNVPVTFPENEGYDVAESGYIRRLGWPWTEGHYQAMDAPGDCPLTVLQKHPKLGIIGGTCSYVPTYLPIWGNPNTFSWEPFLESAIGRDQNRAWHIDYDF